MNIVLASASSYRKALLDKLGLEFQCLPPTLNEEDLKTKLVQQGRSPFDIAETLSLEKGLSVLNTSNQNTLIISGDQLVNFENQILGKPLTTEKAIQQLSLLNNKTHQLVTAITLLAKEKITKYTHVTQLKMKDLSPTEIKNYIKKDKPLDCAGSYKIEQSGIALFESIDCDDFTAIQGIPMIWLSNHLKDVGYEFFKK